MNSRLRPMVAALLLSGSLLTASCARQHQTPGTPAALAQQEDPVQLLAAWLSGSFSSQEQAKSDPSYFDIRLHVAPIWTDRADGPWLYVEQARADTPGTPYRQRVYRVVGPAGSESRFASEVYTLPEPASRFIGAWSDSQRAAFASVTPTDLRKLDGCTVMLAWDSARRTFAGGTQGTGCVSTRDGAKYASSEVTLTEEMLTSWDRGFDADGHQVWGAVKGGYRFIKQP